MPSRIPPAALVSTISRAPVAAAVRTPCATGADPAALVQVGAAEQHQRPLVADRDRPDSAGMALHRGRREAGQGRDVEVRGGRPSRSAAGSQPEPMTRATS